MIQRPPSSTRTDTLFPTRRSSDLAAGETDLTQRAEIGLFYALAENEEIASAVTHIDAVNGRRPIWLYEKGQPEKLPNRSEEHTSELQSLMRIPYAVFCLTKKKTARSRTEDRQKNKIQCRTLNQTRVSTD